MSKWFLCVKSRSVHRTLRLLAWDWISRLTFGALLIRGSLNCFKLFPLWRWRVSTRNLQHRDSGVLEYLFELYGLWTSQPVSVPKWHVRKNIIWMHKLCQLLQEYFSDSLSVQKLNLCCFSRRVCQKSSAHQSSSNGVYFEPDVACDNQFCLSWSNSCC